MVLSIWLEETLEKRRQRQVEAAEVRGRTEGRIEGRTEGFEEASRRWQEWNRRREVAAASGEKFNEPPPCMTTETDSQRQE